MMYQLKFWLEINQFKDYSGSPTVNLLFQGAKKVQQSGPLGGKQLKQPVTFELLTKLVNAAAVCAASKFEELLMKAMFTVAFYGLFRASEITKNHNLKAVIFREDIKHNKNFLILKIHSAKTVKGGELQEVELVKTHDKTCPIQNLKSYLAVSSAKQGPCSNFLMGITCQSVFSRQN